MTKFIDSNAICDLKRHLYTISTHKLTQAHTQINKHTHEHINTGTHTHTKKKEEKSR